MPAPIEQRRLHDALAPALALCAAILGLTLALGFAPYQVDDAFIFYRYAEQLLAGHGLAFNVGAPAVEGFTSPLWLAIVTLLAAAFGSDALPDLGFAAGLAAYLLCLFVAWRASASSGWDATGSGAIVVAILATCPAVLYYAATGMDAVLFCVVVAAYAGAGAGRLPLSLGVAAGAASLWTRPEGGFLPVMLACQVVFALPLDREARRRAAWLVGSVAVSGLSLLVVRWLGFGEILPNTYYAKDPSLAHGVEYVVQTFASTWGIALLILAGAGALFGDRMHRGFLLAALAWMGAAAFEGGDWMRLGRLLLPSFLLLAFAAGGLAGAARWSPPGPRRAAVAAAGAAIAWLAISLTVVGSEQRIAHTTWSSLGAEERQIARWLDESPAESVALVDIGLLAYATSLEILDLGGLTDPTIARSPGGHLDKQFDLAYVFEARRPDVIVIRLRNAPMPGPDGSPQTRPLDAESSVEARLLADPRMPRDYRFALALLPGYERSLYYGRLVFVRKQLDDAIDAGHPFAPSDQGPRVVSTPAPGLQRSASQRGGEATSVASAH